MLTLDLSMSFPGAPKRQMQREHGSAFGRIGGLNHAAMSHDNLLHNPQAQSATVGLGGKERLENRPLSVRGQAWPRVAHGDGYDPVRGVGRRACRDAPVPLNGLN